MLKQHEVQKAVLKAITNKSEKAFQETQAVETKSKLEALNDVTSDVIQDEPQSSQHHHQKAVTADVNTTEHPRKSSYIVPSRIN